MITLNERGELIRQTDTGSHMPLQTAVHWDWRNPLNILPALVLLGFAIAIISCLT